MANTKKIETTVSKIKLNKDQVADEIGLREDMLRLALEHYPDTNPEILINVAEVFTRYVQDRRIPKIVKGS